MTLYKKFIAIIWAICIAGCMHGCQVDQVANDSVAGHVCKNGKLYEAHPNGPFLYDLEEIGICSCPASFDESAGWEEYA